MQENQFNNEINQPYIRLAEAERFVPYSKDYLSLLARQGKIHAKKIGRDWHTTREAIEQYHAEQEARRNVLNTGRPLGEARTRAGYPVNELRQHFAEESPVVAPQPQAQQYFAESRHEASFVQPAAPVGSALTRETPSAAPFTPSPAPSRKGFGSLSLAARIAVPLAALMVIFGGVRLNQLDEAVYGVKDFVAVAQDMQEEFVRVIEGKLLRVDEGGNLHAKGNVNAGGQLVSNIVDGVAPLVVRSSTTVSNLSAEYLDGIRKGDINLAFVTANGASTATRLVLSGGADIASLAVSGTADIASVVTRSIVADEATIGEADIRTADIDELEVDEEARLADTEIDGTLSVSGTTNLRRANVNGRLSVDGTLSVAETVSAQTVNAGGGNFNNVDITNTLTFQDENGRLTNLYKKRGVSENVLITDNDFEVGGALTVGGATSLAGHLTPATDNTYDLGSATLRWRDLYLGPGSLHVYNTIGDDAEHFSLGYSSNVITFTSSADGVGTARNFNFAGGNVGIGTAAPDNALTVDDGSISFSTAGGASDIVLSRGAANRLDLADGDSFRIVGGALQLDLDDTGATQGIALGSTQDVNLYRSAANTLATDDSLAVAAQLQLSASGSVSAGILLGGDVNLYRTASNRLNLGDDDILTLPNRASASNVFVESAVSGDAFYRFQITADGTLQWGPGNALRDVNLYRSAANTLRTDDSLIVAGDLTVSGLTAAGGSVDLGDAVTDTITFVGVVDSDIVPETSTTYDLGSSSRRWAEGYFDSVTANTLVGVVAGGSTTSSTWTINSDNATANAEVSGVAFETGTGNFNATLQWNASGDAGRQSGYDDTLLSNYPIAIFSEVSGGNQTFTSGSLFTYSQNATHAITQSGAFTGINLDFSSNITNTTNNQTGIALTLKDGSISGTATGLSLAGTADYGINLSSATIGTAAISLPTGTAAAQGIDFGGDVNLYRSAANTLRTDDSLIVGTNLTVSGTFDASSSSGSFDSLTIGGGFGSTGVTISSAGAISADSTLTVAGADAYLQQNVYIGANDSYAGQAWLYGPASGSTGGIIRLYHSGDYDTTYEATLLTAYQDDLLVERWDGQDLAMITAEGQLQAPITGSSAGLLIGGDAQLYRGAANRLDLASGDDFYLNDGDVTLAGANPTVRIGTTTAASVTAGVDIVNSGGYGVLLSNTVTDATTKAGSLMVRHYTNTEEPFRVIAGNSASAVNTVLIGGGTSLQNSATNIDFYTAADTTTVTGTLVGSFNGGGQLQLPVTGSSAGLLIGGDTQLYRGGANRLDLADGDSLFVRTGHIGFGAEASTLSGTGIKQTSGGYFVTQSDAGVVFTADANNNDTDAFRFYQDGTELSGSLIAEITSNGELALPTAGSGGGVVIGGDARIYRGAANRLDLASGDSLKLVSGSLGINVDPPTDAAFRADFTSTATSGNAWGGRLFVNASPSSASSASFYGAQIGTAGTATANITGAIHGARISNFSGAAGGVTITTAEALQLQAIQITTGATITNARGLNVQDLQVSGGSVVTHNYGIYVSNQTAGTNDYGIAIAGADTQALWVGSGADNTDAANGIAFGASRDTNLYRGAANFLATDDNFQARGGTLNAGIDGTTNGTVNVFSGATSGSTLRIYLAENADTNLDYYSFLTSSGDETLYLNAGSSRAMSWTHTASAVNRINVTGGAAGNAPILSAAGLDTDINIQLTPKGTGDVIVSTGQLQLSEQGFSGGLLIGGDVQIYREAANILTAADRVRIRDERIQVYNDVSTDIALDVYVSGETFNRLQVRSDGLLQWSDGANTYDTQLYRGAANRLDLASGDSFNIVNGNLRFGTTSTGILDANSNEMLILSATSSAVNHIQIRNNATGLFPSLTAVGDDTNIGFDISSKGSGSIRFWANNSSTFLAQFNSSGKLQVTTTGSSGGIELGGDFHLYRLAADFGYTPDTLQVGGAFQADTTAYFPSTSGAGANLVIGGDTNLYRGAANRLDLASGDSFSVVSGGVGIGAANTNTNTFYLTGASSPGGTGSVFDINPTMSGDLNFFNFVARVRGSFTTSTAILGTGNAGFHMLGIDTEALNSSAGALTIAQASGIYLEGAPSAGTDITITNAYALFVDSGLTRLDGGIEVGSLSTANTTALCWDNSGNSLIYDCNGSATDLAELYGTADASIEAADIVVSAGEAQAIADPNEGEHTSRAFVEKSTQSYQHDLIGVISTNPNQVYGEDGVFTESDNPRPVSLAGRVPVKVTTQNGSIKTGDAITSSDVPGVGMKATKAGRIVGLALSSYENEDTAQVGTVIVFVNPTWWSPEASGLALQQPGGEGESQQTIIQQTIQTIATSVEGLATATVDGVKTFFFDGAIRARGAFAGLFDVSGERIASFATSFISSIRGNGDIFATTSELRQEASADGSGAVRVTTYSVQSSRQEIMISGTGMMRECFDYSAGGVSGCNAVAGKLGFATSFASDDVAGIVAFAPEFSALLDGSEEVRVIVTPTDELFGTLYVAEKSVRGFVVGESITQDAGVTFDWIIIARIGDGTGVAQIEEVFAQNEVIEEPISNPPTLPAEETEGGPTAPEAGENEETSTDEAVDIQEPVVQEPTEGITQEAPQETAGETGEGEQTSTTTQESEGGQSQGSTDSPTSAPTESGQADNTSTP